MKTKLGGIQELLENAYETAIPLLREFSESLVFYDPNKFQEKSQVNKYSSRVIAKPEIR